MSTKQKTRRAHGTGGMRRRGKDSWELKIRTVDPKTAKRVARFVSFKGTEAAAKRKLQELRDAATEGALPDERKTFGVVLDAWEASLNVSPKTAERWRELVRLYIRPQLGGLAIRKIAASRLDTFYSDLCGGNGPDGGDATKLSPRTIELIHRLVVQVFALAERDRLIAASPARHAKRPKIEDAEIEILSEEQVRDVLGKLRGRPIYPIALLGLATGMRRGEMLALRWRDVDFDKSSLRVEQSLEQTKEGLRFKSPKTKHGRRTLTVPATVLRELQGRRAKQAEQRLALGLGKAGDDALVFARPDGSPLLPNSVSTEWRRLVSTLKLPKVSLHAWRHTHASQLIASGMDVLTISRRLGHGSPSITLDVYSHLFKPTDKAAAAVFETAFGNALADEITSTDGERSANEIGGKLAAAVLPLRLPTPSSI